MDSLITFLNTTGETFIGFSVSMLIQSSMLIIILLIMDLFLRKRVRAVFRYCIWMLVLVKLVLPVSLSSPVSIGYWLADIVPNTIEEPVSIERPIVEFADIESISATAIPEMSITSSGQISTLPESIELAVEETVVEIPAQQDAIVSLAWQGFVFLGFFVVVIAMTLLLLQRMFFVRGLIAQSKEPGDSMIAVFEKCKKQIVTRGHVALKLSPVSASPSVCGLIQPTILIPQNLSGQLNTVDFESIFLHELAHIKRGDLLLGLIQTILQIAYFYNPLLWIANAVIRSVREQANDEMVLATMGEKAENYPQSLFNISKMAFSRPALSLRLIGVVESRNALTGRIKHILNRPFPNSAELGILGLFVVIAVGVILLPMAKAASEQQFVIKDVVTDSGAGRPIAGVKVDDVELDMYDSPEAENNIVQVEPIQILPVGDYALEFDGKNDILVIPASESLELGRNFTIEMWVKPDFSNTNTLHNEHNLLSRDRYIDEIPDKNGTRMSNVYGFGFCLKRYGISEVALDISTANKGIFTNTYVFQYTSDWMHLVFCSAQNTKISGGINYIDTDPEVYEPAPKNNINFGRGYIGSAGNNFKGQLAELRIWNRSLSVDEIEKYKTTALAGNEPNLVGCWTFEQEPDNQRMRDISPYKNDASLGSSYTIEDSDPVLVHIGE